MRHNLKTWPSAFVDTEKGVKRAEFRKDDRGFAVDDVLLLCEWDPLISRFTGNQLLVVVKHLVRGPSFGIPEGYVVMSIEKQPPSVAMLGRK